MAVFLQDGFSRITEENVGKALHALCITGVFDLSTFQTNTLVSFYSKFGRIEYARYLFDKTPVKNEASWNTMLSGYVRVGLYSEALEFFVRNWGQGLYPNGFVLASLITACDRSCCMVEEGVQLHCLATKIGLKDDVFVGSSLLHLYGAYKFVCEARKFFEDMPYRNFVSWTSLMVGYLNQNDPTEVINLYRRMRHEGVICNQNTLATVISSCSLLDDTCVGHQVLAHVVKLGLGNSVSVANSLISMFGSFCNVEKAQYVFGVMDERDTISWNSIISAHANNGLYKESFDCFYLMRHANSQLNSTTLSTLLTICGSSERLKWGKGIQSLVVKVGLNTNTCTSNSLLSMYSEAGRPADAELVFDEMSERDVISWNAMMACYVQDEKSTDALRLLAEMLWMRDVINYVTFVSALAACSSQEFTILGKIVHALVIVAGLQDNLVIGNALISMYGFCHLMVDAEKVFETVRKHDEVSWNALIGGYAENEEREDALKAFRLMRQEGPCANYITIVNILSACSTSSDLLTHGKPIHAHTILTGLESDKYVCNSLISMYAKCGDLSSSDHIFHQLDNEDVVTWNAMIAANAHHGHAEEAIKLIARMRTAELHLDHFSFSGGFAAAANLALLEEGRQIHALVMKLGYNTDLYVINAAMDMYGKCGEIDDVLRILPEPMNRTRMSWNVLISAFARHGCFEEAREAFHEMVELGVKPDHVTFVSLLCACSHGGLVDEGLAYYASMTTNFAVSPAIEHCVCMVDLLGRAGRLAAAQGFIERMPVPPNDHVWRSLLAASKVHGDLELGKKAVEHLFELDPSDDSAYVLYSNVCATSRRWEDVESIRRQMGSIRKKPGCSWVKLKDKVSSFGMGDKSHPQSKQINEKLVELKKMITEAGYVPDTSYALQDTDEEQKEHNLWEHSERLALAFGLINTPDGSAIRVFKNLRVCGDCHSVYKLVSQIVCRRIILRDPYRFHHFSEGRCSCSDYW